MLKVTIWLWNDDDSSSQGIPQFDPHHNDAGKRHASHCDRPIWEHDIWKSVQLWEKMAHLWEKLAHLWDSIMKSAHLSESAQLWESAFLGEPAQLWVLHTYELG